MTVRTDIPFRFKAGSNMGSEPFHHRRSSQNTHKAFKSRHATKSLLKEIAKGKTDNLQKKENRKTPHQQIMSKFDRRNQAKQLRQVKNQQNAKSSSVFHGPNGAPRIITVVPLSSDVDIQSTVEKLSDAADAEVQWPLSQQLRVRVDRFKQSLLFLSPGANFFDTLDACRMADFVMFIFDSQSAPDEGAEILVRALEGQGVSNALAMVQNLEKLGNAKRKSQWVLGLKDWLGRFFPWQDKVLDLGSAGECANAVRSLCTTTPKGVRWREDRSWMLVEDVRWPSSSEAGNNHEADTVVTGVVRGKGLKADRLVQVGDYGSFQINKITDATLPPVKKRKANEAPSDQPTSPEFTLQAPGGEAEDMQELAPVEMSMEDVDGIEDSELSSRRKGVLLDDDRFYSDGEDDDDQAPRKRVPKGTSKYQSAWFLGDESGSESDYEDFVDEEGDVSMNAPDLPQDGLEGLDNAPDLDQIEAASEYPTSEMFLDPSPAQEAAEIEEYRKSRKKEEKEDLEFPDEIELHPNVLARERLAKYRGLKSLKSSPWDTSEDRPYEPEDWHRLLQVLDHKRVRRTVENDALIGGIPAGTRVNVHLRSAPNALKKQLNPKRPLSLYSLLRHEQKRSVVNISISLSSSEEHPLKSKDELIMQCGPRRFVINPLFSQLGSTPNDVHKFLRYLHPGQTAVATFMAPVTWGSVPVLFFQRSADDGAGGDGNLRLVATGTTLPPSTTRVIAKRAILTGHPFKIHRKLVTIRYMFFNKEDVQWFKALPLWTRRGRSGFVKESLGTHGYFKATFDGKVNPQDAVGVSLYKRVWPRLARPVKEGELKAEMDGRQSESMEQ